jgi:hypothetical protein
MTMFFALVLLVVATTGSINAHLSRRLAQRESSHFHLILKSENLTLNGLLMGFCRIQTFSRGLCPATSGSGQGADGDEQGNFWLKSTNGSNSEGTLMGTVTLNSSSISSSFEQAAAFNSHSEAMS